MFIHDTNSSIGQEQFSDDSDVGETIGESGNVAEAEWAVEAENTTSDESIEEPLEYSNIDGHAEEEDTFERLLQRSIRTAIELKARGVISNDIVCLCSYNHLNSCIPYTAGLFIGTRLCALDPSMSYSDNSGRVVNDIIQMPDLDYFPNPNGVGYELFESMKRNKGLLAQIDSQTGQTDTYDELLPRCIRTAITLQAHNLTSNDIICLCSYNQLNSCVPYLAGLFIGVKVCSLDPSMSFTESKHLLNQVKPKIIFVVSEKKKMYENLLDDISLNAEVVEFCEEGFGKFLKPSPDEDKFAPVKVANLFDTAVIMFSSGTTGLAKGICLNHYSLLCQVKNFISFECDTTRCLSFATFYWISAVFLLIQSIMKGSARILCKNFEPLHVWYTISNFKATYLFMASNQAIALLKTFKPRSVCTDSLKIIHAGGGPISPDHLLSLRELLPNVDVVLVYGQTEVAGFGFMFKTTSKDDMILMKRKPKSCGKPIRGFWYKIVDVETGKTLGRNQIGELRFKTRFQLNGYYNLDSSGIWDSEGWLKTGDICYYDEDQCFFIVDRIKEMMKFQSWHVAPAFIEGILYGHFAVKVAVVIGVPHDEDGEHPLGIIVLSEEAKGVKAETLVEYVNSRVDDRQKLRAGIVFVDDIPYTPSGKIKRNALKHTILERLGIGCKA
ncbi:long-chain-fatty-acid--coa ligase [Holotrichia oblita]|uniref:Long-chain-fatty-acid--coa ligase n=1 Tax=Holotrichia oblita TaxID=644536 RepID=A0ACB9TX33_HOLOL|nr:long-chain-fatty-acid--coa ligase [Holotrichia oblita]